MRLPLFLSVLLGATVLSAAELTVQQRCLVRELERMNPAALTRFADDWEETYGESKELADLRELIQALPTKKQNALTAIRVQNDDSAAKALTLEVKRVILAQPLFKDMEILSTKYDYGVNARRQGAPGQPSMACYNMIEANQGLNSQLVKISDLTAETPKVETIYDSPRATLSCVDLHWDADKVCFIKKDPADGNRIKLWKLKLDGSAPKAVTPAGVDYDIGDGCFLPDGKYIVTATAAEQGLPCESGRMAMTNTYRYDAETCKMERLTFDQDSNWSPCVMEDGRVMFVRWEYCDQTHFFTRIVMTMRPDGTRQLAYFGSNGFWPNHYGDPLPIPGANGRFICVATGHHASKSGRLALFNVAAEGDDAGILKGILDSQCRITGTQTCPDLRADGATHARGIEIVTELARKRRIDAAVVIFSHDGIFAGIVVTTVAELF